MTWEPKAGTGWRKGGRKGTNSWGLMLEDDQTGPVLFVTVHADDVFEIARSPSSFVYECPGPADIGRVERDFGVYGWSVSGFSVRPGASPDTGHANALLLKAHRRCAANSRSD